MAGYPLASPLLPLGALYGLATSGDLSPEWDPWLFAWAAALWALMLVAFWAVFFTQWWQPVYVFAVFGAFVPSMGEDWPVGLLLAEALGALAATGILLRLLVVHLRRRSGAASVGVLAHLCRSALRAHGSRRHPPHP